MSISENLDLDNPVFLAYVFWSTVLIFKMLFMSFLTGRQRFNTKVGCYLKRSRGNFLNRIFADLREPRRRCIICQRKEAKLRGAKCRENPKSPSQWLGEHHSVHHRRLLLRSADDCFVSVHLAVIRIHFRHRGCRVALIYTYTPVPFL